MPKPAPSADPRATTVQYASSALIPSFHRALDRVARERVYLEMTEAPPLEKVREFQEDLIARNGPVYYAVRGAGTPGAEVVGWCDVFPFDSPRQSHRGGLGMGLLPEYRGQGIGSRLVEATLAHARRFGLEKVELHVYTSNPAAIALYRKHGFVEEGLIRHYRKLDDGTYFDCLAMAKFL